MQSLKAALPAGFDLTKGIKSLRVRDSPPVSIRSMTPLVSADRNSTDMNAGHVYATQVKLRVWGNGSWWFFGKLDDTSVVFGDNYAIGFSFEDSGFAGIKSGVLGADETSTPQHITFAIQGRSETLQRNYFQILAGGVKFRLYQSGDLEQALSDIGDDLKWLGKQIEVAFSADSSDQGPDDPTWPPIENGGGGGEDDDE
jgi:hypothetical protein